MLILGSKLHSCAVVSIRTNGVVARVVSPIINPHNLHIDAFYCESRNIKHHQVLLDTAIREFSTGRMFINDSADLSDPSELVRLQTVLKLNFSLDRKLVKTNTTKLGKVVDFAFDKNGLFVQKLYVQPPMWKGFVASNLTIDRTSILEVTDSYILVRGPEVKDTVATAQKVPKSKIAPSYSASTSFMRE